MGGPGGVGPILPPPDSPAPVSIPTHPPKEKSVDKKGFPKIGPKSFFSDTFWGGCLEGKEKAKETFIAGDR